MATQDSAKVLFTIDVKEKSTNNSWICRPHSADATSVALTALLVPCRVLLAAPAEWRHLSANISIGAIIKTGQTIMGLTAERMTWKILMFLMVCALCHGNVTKTSKCSANLNNRFDCAPEKAVKKEECETRGCCYIPVEKSDNASQPTCFFPPSYPNYKMVNYAETETGYSAFLARSQPAFMPGDLMKLHMNVNFETENRLRITIKDATQDRYEVPLQTPKVTKKANPVNYDVQFNSDSFGFTVRRKSNGNMLVNSNVCPLIYADQFIQFCSSLPSTYIYGLGEHLTSLNLDLNWTKYTFWNRDLIPRENANLYGEHPFYLGLENDGSAHGVFLLNSNAMDVILQPAPAITWRTIGGIVDLYVFMGPDTKSVIQQYQDVIGFPHMPPYWALGFHLCRWGYKTSAETEEAAMKMREAGIPQDTQWNDIDYMDLYRDFKYDKKRYGDLPAMVARFHKLNMKYVMIMEPAIASSAMPADYPPYADGLKRGIYVTNSSGQPLIGKVWPGETAFVDYSNPEAHKWWHENFKSFHAEVPFDGVWIDMNEPANNVHGSVHGCPDDNLENPPYLPNVVGGKLSDTTICASSHQHLSSHYNLHNMHGYFESMASYNAMLDIRKKRPFVLSRSNYAGLGRYAAHWTGDIESTWKQLYYTVPAMILNNMYGIPLVGADIGGFVGDVTEELSVRWHQLGSFYTFMRNHNTRDAKSQEPYVYSEASRKAIKKAVLRRYMLLPYLYTLFQKSHTKAEMVTRALFMEFPSDRTTWTIDRQFMWGGAFLVTPVLEEGKTEVNGYFPAGRWYDPAWGTKIESKGEWKNLPAPLDTINIHIRGGFIVPAQEPALTTTDARKNKMLLLVALTEEGEAHGDLFWDDGDSVDTYEKGQYSYITFSAQKNTLVSNVEKSEKEGASLAIHLIGVFGVPGKPKEVLVNGVPTQSYKYFQGREYLRIHDLDLKMDKAFKIEW